MPTLFPWLRMWSPFRELQRSRGALTVAVVVVPQPLCWCNDTLRSHLVVAVFVLSPFGGALTPCMMVTPNPHGLTGVGQALTVAVVVVPQQ